MTGTFRYPRAALAADYARSVAGLACTLVPLALLRPVAAIGWILGGAAALFFVYFGRTVVRQFTRIEVDDDGIRASGAQGDRIRWKELRSLRLNYYSTRGDRVGGWMQLGLRGAQRSISVDSRLEGFVQIAAVAAREANRHGCPIDARSRANLVALGVTADSGRAADA